MLLTLAETILPAVVVLVTLFGVLARGDPKPGGVALFLRVGVVGFVLAAVIAFVVEKTAVLGGRPEVVVNAYRGLGLGGVALIVMGVFGKVLQKQQ